MSTSQRKFVVLGENDSYEYDIIVDDMGNYERAYSLYYSKNPPWSEHTQGKLALKLVDTGNKFIFSPKLKDFDYDIAAYVRILLNFASTYDNNKIKYTIAEHNIIIKF